MAVSLNDNLAFTSEGKLCSNLQKGSRTLWRHSTAECGSWILGYTSIILILSLSCLVIGEFPIVLSDITQVILARIIQTSDN